MSSFDSIPAAAKSSVINSGRASSSTLHSGRKKSRLFMIASALALVPRLFVLVLRESCNDKKLRRTIYYLAIVDSISSIRRFASSSIIESISRSIRASFGALACLTWFSVMMVAISANVGASNI